MVLSTGDNFPPLDLTYVFIGTAAKHVTGNEYLNLYVNLNGKTT